LNTKHFKIILMVFMVLALTACADSSKPKSSVTEEQIRIDAVKADLIEGDFSKLISLTVISQPVQGIQSLVVADLTYDNGEALVSGQVVINYEWNNKAWKAVNTQFSYNSVSVKEEAPVADILGAAGIIPDLNAQFQNFAFSSDPVLVSKELALEIGEATYVITRSASTEKWTSTTTYMISAKYNHGGGWQFTLNSWTYTETTNWAGTWVIQWATYDKETQYTPNEKMTVTITGDMTLTHNSANDQNETRTVNVVFKRSGSGYNLPAILSSNYLDEGLYTTRFMIIKYGNQNNDQLYLELEFDLTGANPISNYVAKSYDGNVGLLTKIK
jgi:hypothetical protein